MSGLQRLTQSIFIFSLLLFVVQEGFTQSDDLVEIVYTSTDENFPNPERGFYTYNASTPSATSSGSSLNAQTLRQNRDEGRSLIIRLYNIGAFRYTDLSENFLQHVEADLEAVREAGMKMVIRFRYSTSEAERDAPLEWVLRHLDQLEPVFKRNYDVITAANGGFIGAWGEWHASYYNLTTTANMRAILHKFMDVLPMRSVQIRYPQAKMLIYNSNQPIQPEDAYDGSYKSRAGHVNDCFLASPTDVGTYRVPPAPYNFEKDFIAADTRYVPIGGETCNPRPDAGERYHCTTALEELDRMNWSFLNLNYSRIILDHWIDEGCYPEIERRLGYRFEIEEGRYTDMVKPGGKLRFEIDLKNSGFASPYNPREVQVIMRSFDNTDDVWEVYLPVDPRLWMSGETQNLEFDIAVPTTVTDGMYELLLAFPDPTENLRHLPEFSIRLANDGVWEPETGFNKLNQIIFVDENTATPDFESDVTFAPFGTTTSAEEFRSALPVNMQLHQNYPNPFNPSTTIKFELNNPKNVKLEVFDLLGKRLAVLLDGHRSEGQHSVQFDGSSLSSGMYIYRLQSAGEDISRHMTLIK
ncbi:MAG: DUF4832 domain-containing protein [Balneolales bacterium]|nr:DUF4832 domain-containing protein [Balneolales bacterium]